jgi:hydrogenase expression/formation protein HypC
MCLAVPGQVIAIEGDEPLTRQGRVDFGGVTRLVNLAYVPEVVVGDTVLVHVGFAISRLNEAEAARTYALLDELGALEPEPEPESEPTA